MVNPFSMMLPSKRCFFLAREAYTVLLIPSHLRTLSLNRKQRAKKTQGTEVGQHISPLFQHFCCQQVKQRADHVHKIKKEVEEVKPFVETHFTNNCVFRKC
jgi:hypothetical protein